jgi:hypothetical protein
METVSTQPPACLSGGRQEGRQEGREEDGFRGKLAMLSIA